MIHNIIIHVRNIVLDSQMYFVEQTIQRFNYIPVFMNT